MTQPRTTTSMKGILHLISELLGVSLGYHLINERNEVAWAWFNRVQCDCERQMMMELKRRIFEIWGLWGYNFPINLDETSRTPKLFVHGERRWYSTRSCNLSTNLALPIIGKTMFLKAKRNYLTIRQIGNSARDQSREALNYASSTLMRS